MVEQAVETRKKRILVIRYRFIGDTILTVPFLRNLRKCYPEAQIDVLVGPQSGQVLQGCPYVDNLIEFDTTRFHKYDQGQGEKKSFFYYVSLLREKDYNTVFILKRSLSSAILAYLIGARERIGYAGGLKSLFLTKSVFWNKNKHEVESTLDILRGADIPVLNNYLEAWCTETEFSIAKSFLPEFDTKKYMLIHGAAAHPDKMYPNKFWSVIIRELYDHGLVAVLSGAAADFQLNQEIISASGVDCINLAGKLSLRESMALYGLMQIAICVDSGPAHLAAAIGTPTVSIFGPTDPVRWAPFGEIHRAVFDQNLPCRPCNYKKTCAEKRQCLTELNPKLVVQQALEIYKQLELTG